MSITIVFVIPTLNLKVKKQGLVANLVIDGKVMPNNLKNIKKDENWLRKELKVKGYEDLDNILLVTFDMNEKLVIYEKNSGLEPFNVLE